MHSRLRPYKGIRIHLFTYAFFLLCLSIFCTPELQRPSPHFPPQPSPAMSGAGGKWMVSSVTEGHVKKLRKAGYLSKDIAHRLLEEGHLLPTPRPHERVVFLPHFLRGLGFPLHPFVRGSFSTTAWISTIWPRTSSSTSRRLSSCARLSSASAPISASGSRPSTSSPRWCAAARRSAEAPWRAR